MIMTDNFKQTHSTQVGIHFILKELSKVVTPFENQDASNHHQNIY